jgi:acetolactate synthase I/II/III large subunit
MTLAELIVADAANRGLRHFFGLPGSGCPMDMMDAGRRMGVEFVTVAHESSAAIMAAYNGAMHATAGLALAIRGVGAGNLAAGAVNAYFERVPVVCVCESSPASVTQKELIQHCSHKKLFGAVTKFQADLSPETGPETLRNAVEAAVHNRPGPALLDLASNLGGAESRPPLPVRAPAPAPTPTEPQLAAAADFIRRARRPLVIAGSDVVRAGATAELLQFVETIEAAVLVNADARGVLDERHPRWAGAFMGTFGPNIIETEMLGRADAVILIGADSMMSHSPWNSPLPTCELVLRPEYETLSPKPAARVDGDLRVTLQRLTAPRPGFPEAEIAQARAKILVHFRRPSGARLAAQDVIEISRRLLPDDGILFSETGAAICMLEHLWPVSRPGTYFGTSGGRTMGLTLPAILGAKLARPETPMLGIGSDGSTLMRLGELEVFARTAVKVPLVILNDHALGTIKSRQRSRGMAEYKLDLHPVDLAGVARACGLLGVTVRSPEEFEKALAAALTAERTTLIDAQIDARPYQDSFGPTIGVLQP